MNIILQPLAVISPNAEFIYALSRLEPQKEITEQEFAEKYADHARAILISFEPNGISNAQPWTAYGFGWDCWYLIF